MVGRLMALALALSACTVQAQFPTALVLTHEFTDDQAVRIVAAVDVWTAVGAHLSISIGDPGHAVNLDDGITPVYPAVLFGALGLTNKNGVQLDVVQIERQWPDRPEAMQWLAQHEFGHVLGLGPPADGSAEPARAQHIHVDGDIMCDTADCVMMGDGTLSADDIEAWRAGGAR